MPSAVFFQYFAMHTNASYQYMGVAKAKIGEAITGADADPLNIRLVPTLDGSAKKRAVRRNRYAGSRARSV